MRHPDAARRGVAAALALVVLIALGLLSALFLEAALTDLRGGTALLASARVATLAEDALERALSRRLDSADVARPPGVSLIDERSATPDSVHTLVRLLQAGVAEVHVSVRSEAGRIRVIAGRLAYARVLPDPATPGRFALRPLPTHWWVPEP